MVSGVSTDHERGPGYRRTMDPNKALRGSTDYRHQHGFRLKHRAQTSTWHSVITRATHINTDPSCSKIWDPDTDLGTAWIWKSLWLAVQATQISMSPVSSMVHERRHGFRL